MKERRFGVGFGKPDFAGLKVGEERGKVNARNLAGPDDTGVINIRGVVNPFALNIVIWRITNNDEMVSGNLSKFGDDAGALPVVVIGQTDFGVRPEDMLDKADRDHGKSESYDSSCPADADGAAAALPTTKMTESLNQNDQQDAKGWSGIVRIKPNNGQHPQSTKKKLP